jgi:hypothetical protein
MRKLIVLLIVVAVAFGALFAASPWWTLFEMSMAVKERDDARFARHVDFAALREDLKGSMQARMIGEMERRGDAGDPAGAAGMALGMLLADRMMDEVISPEALRALFEQARAMDGAGGPGSSGSIKQMVEASEVDWRGLSEFRLVNTANPAAPELEFRRDGLLNWKLSGVELKTPGERL